jgi:uncharacterized membrane protein YphA (DoxX/SURF4 family)
VHDYAEFWGGWCLVLGFLTRPAALSLVVTMMGAVNFHLSSVGLQGFPLGHVPNYSYDFEEPVLYSLIFLLFWFNGAGTYDYEGLDRCSYLLASSMLSLKSSLADILQVLCRLIR